MTDLAPHLTAFLREHLPRDRNASPHTVATYAHCFSLLIRFAAKRLSRRPCDLCVEDLSPDLVLKFLDDIEAGRGNCARTRNARLAAIRAFFRYLEYQVPACLDQAARIRALPQKRTDTAGLLARVAGSVSCRCGARRRWRCGLGSLFAPKYWHRSCSSTATVNP